MTGMAVAVIQARMSSTRLPGKVLMPLGGRPMLAHIVDRARQCVTVTAVIVATSTETSDDPIAEFCEQNKITCYRGSLDDVLGRFLGAIAPYSEPYIVRITGDCPLIHPPFIDWQVRALMAADADMVWMQGELPLLEGQGVHSRRSLEFVATLSQHPDDREHVGSRYFSEHRGTLRTVGLMVPDWLMESGWRLTVDQMEDYRLMDAIYRELWQGHPIPLDKVVDWLKAHPDQVLLNQQVQHSAINQELAAKRRQCIPSLVQTFSWQVLA